MVSKKRRKRENRFQYSVNRSKLNARRKKQVLYDDILKQKWDKTKSSKSNMEAMGFKYSANEKKGERKRKKADPETAVVVDMLEEQVKVRAANRQAKAPRITFREQEFIKSMIARHGNDYQAMARDPKNYFQDTANQIRKRVAAYLSNAKYVVSELRERGVIKQHTQSKDANESATSNDDNKSATPPTSDKRVKEGRVTKKKNNKKGKKKTVQQIQNGFEVTEK